jgi:hypothetical protein
MKKTIFLLAILSIILFACNPLKPSSSAEPSNFVSSDSIPSSAAIDMINHYLDPIVSHNLDSIIKQISLYNSDLYKIFKLKKITRIRLITAAYLATDTITRRNLVTVLVQLKQGYHSNYYYYDIRSLQAAPITGGGRICPPPPTCSPTSP